MSISDIETFRIALFGAPGVGKSSLTTRVTLDTFSEEYDPTLEHSYRRKVSIDGKTCFLELIDIPINKSYQALRDQMISTSDAALLVYSITSLATLQTLAHHHQMLKDTKTKEGMWDPFQICIVGNKHDLEEERNVSVEQGRYYAGKLGCPFEECSAKTGDNVDKVAFDIVRRIITYRDNERIRYEQIQAKAMRDLEKKTSRKGVWKKIFK